MIPREFHTLENFFWFLDNSRRRYRLVADDDDAMALNGDPVAVLIIHRDGTPPTVAPFDPHTFEDNDAHADDLLVQSLREAARLAGGLGR